MKGAWQRNRFLFFLVIIFLTLFTRGCNESGEIFASAGFPMPWLELTYTEAASWVGGLTEYWWIWLGINLLFFFVLWKQYADVVKTRTHVESFFLVAVWMSVAIALLVLIPNLQMLTMYLLFLPLSFLSSGIEALHIIPEAWRVDSFVYIDIVARLQYLLYVVLGWLIYRIGYTLFNGTGRRKR